MSKQQDDPHDDLLLIHRLMIDAETLRQVQRGRRLMATVSLTEIADNLSEAALVIHELETTMASRAPRLAPPKPRPTVTMEHEPEMRPDIAPGQRAQGAAPSSLSLSLAERWLASEKGQMLTGVIVNRLREDVAERPETVARALENKAAWFEYGKARNPRVPDADHTLDVLWMRYHGFRNSTTRHENLRARRADPKPVGNSASPGGEHDRPGS